MVIDVYLNSSMVILVIGGYQWLSVVINKDTGGKKILQHWIRGHFFIVRGGGHIDAWQPLYQ